ncbi:hypothetical protein [Sphaerisporangium corydalis]|uniref:Uncharacterized protein n=1 Tax=Sphaerisporangium corydalis TaxID=1441875 RepID=A0ABV9EQR5_9ACTN|nr:hypothetical protein [Sphaerisporangium corydalis]
MTIITQDKSATEATRDPRELNEPELFAWPLFEGSGEPVTREEIPAAIGGPLQLGPRSESFAGSFLEVSWPLDMAKLLENSPSGARSFFDLGGVGAPLFRDQDGQRDADEECGRGLCIVAVLADRAGYQGSPHTGHRLWAYLAAPVSESDL